MKAILCTIPNQEEILDDLEVSVFFSTLFLFSGYCQIHVMESSKEYSTFVGMFETYQFEVRPFGLFHAPSTFERVIEYVLSGLPFLRVYLDDVVIFSNTIEEHQEHVKTVIQLVTANGLKRKIGK